MSSPIASVLVASNITLGLLFSYYFLIKRHGVLAASVVLMPLNLWSFIVQIELGALWKIVAFILTMRLLEMGNNVHPSRLTSFSLFLQILTSSNMTACSDGDVSKKKARASSTPSPSITAISLEILATFLITQLGLFYFKLIPFNPFPDFFAPMGFFSVPFPQLLRSIAQVYVIIGMIYAFMVFYYNILFHLLLPIVTGHASEPLFRNPFAATSITDFWRRWNLQIQATLYKLVYKPTLLYTLKVWPVSSSGDRLRHHRLIATCTTFFFSAIMHEYITNIITDLPPSFESLTFFLVQSLAISLERLVPSQSLPIWTRRGTVL